MISNLAKLLQPARFLIRPSSGLIPKQCPYSSTTIPTPADSTLPVPESSVIPEPDSLFSKLEIELKGNDPAVLKSYAFFATTAANHLNIDVGKSWALRKANHNRFVLLKSVHIYKKHRVHYEIRTYFRFMHFHKLTGSTLSTFLEYIERNLPEGVAMKTTKIEVQSTPEHLQTPPAQV